MKAVRIKPRVMRRRPHTPLRAPLDGAPILHAFEFPARDERSDPESEGDPDYGPDPDGMDFRQRTRSLRRATLASSGLPHQGMHFPMLDLDHHVELYASSTPGKHHLYIGTPITWAAYENLLDAFVEAGLVEPGYVAASQTRGYTSLRLPWVRKRRSHEALEEARYERPLSWMHEDRDSVAVEMRIRGRLRRLNRQTLELQGAEPQWVPGVMALLGRERVVRMLTPGTGGFGVENGPRDQHITYTATPSPTVATRMVYAKAREIAAGRLVEVKREIKQVEADLDEEIGNLSGTSQAPY